VNARRSLPALLALAVLAAVYLAHALVVDRDFTAFLPGGGDAGQRFLAAQLRDGAAARLVLVRVSGGDVESLAAASEALRGALAQDDHFDYIANGSLAAAMHELPVLHAARYALAADAGARMSVDGLRKALQLRLDALQSATGMLEKRWLYDDPTGETLALLATLGAGGTPRREAGVWFDRAGTGAMLVARARAPASDAAQQNAARAALEAAFARVGQGHSLEFSSAGFLAAQSEAIIAHDVERLSWIAAAGVVLILLAAYRSLPIVALCLVPAVSGLVVGLCAITAGFHSVHALTLAFGATLIGEAVDYPTYVLTQFFRGRSLGDVRRALRRPFVLSVLTTTCGALAFLAAGVDGLVEVGVLTSVGVLVAGVLAWWMVPAMLPSGWRFAGVAVVHGANVARWPASIALMAAALVTIALGIGATGKPWFDDDPARMNPLPRAAIARDAELRAASGAPDVSRFIVVRAQDESSLATRVEAVSALLDHAVAAGRLAGYDAFTRYVPSAATQHARRAALPDVATLQARLDAAASDTPFRAAAFAPFLRDVEAARTAPDVQADRYDGTAIGLRLATLMGRDSEGAWALLPLTGLADANALARDLQEHGERAELVDLRARSSMLFARLRSRTGLAIAGGVLAIALCLVGGLRSGAAAARALGPALAGAAWAALAMVAFGGGLSIFHLIALMLVIGIGVNYGLFLEEMRLRHDSPGALALTLVVVGATTLCAFAAMASSSIPVLRAIGATVVVGTASTLLVCALVAGSKVRAGPA
jgi:predicted exporter